MSGNRVTFTLSPKSPYVDCSWMDGPQVGRKTIEFSAFVKAIQESTPAPTACSGLLPPGTISYCESSNHQITMTVESSDEYADITYFNTRYEHFPLPHLIFQFSFFEGQRVQSVRIGVAERERLRPDSRMFYYAGKSFQSSAAGAAKVRDFSTKQYLIRESGDDQRFRKTQDQHC